MAVKSTKNRKKILGPHTKAGELFSSYSSTCKYSTLNVKYIETLRAFIAFFWPKWKPTRTNYISGYRTKQHDKSVGGSGTGPHTKGWAIDFNMGYKGGLIPSIVLLVGLQIIMPLAKGLEMILGGTNAHIDSERPDKWFARQKKNSKGKYEYPTLSSWLESAEAKKLGLKRPKIKAKKNQTIRKSHNSKSKKLGMMKKGTTAYVYGAMLNSANNLWLKTDKGWVYSGNVKVV